ncbi:MAG: hypothetical protein H6R18_290 [Proteobacteria bacterium]|nr:hypothetical protein [Pseudomonadota bacterium]
MEKLCEDNRRPMRDLLLQLPLLSVTPSGEIDYEAADPDLLVQIADNAEISMRTIHLGLSAIGILLAHAAPELETGDVTANVIEAIGWTMAEMGDFASTAHCLAVASRRYTTDYNPQESHSVANVKP